MLSVEICDASGAKRYAFEIEMRAARPVVENEVVDGVIRGRRTEWVTYVCRRHGLVDLPKLTIVWWNTAEERVERVKLPGRTMAVSPPPAEEQPGYADRGSWWIFALILLVATSLMVLRSRRAILDLWTTWRDARARAESVRFRRLRRACRRNDPIEAYEALTAWLEVRSEGPGSPTLVRFAESCGNRVLARELEALKQAVLAKDGGWRGARLARSLAQSRNRKIT